MMARVGMIVCTAFIFQWHKNACPVTSRGTQFSVLTLTETSEKVSASASVGIYAWMWLGR